jgi:hypothetical protein
VLVATGFDGNNYPNSAELYDPVAGTWATTGALGIARAFHTATLLRSGKVLVAGGYNFNLGGPLSGAELFDPATGAWSATSGLNTARSNHTATMLPSGKVVVAGGFGVLSSAEVYGRGPGFDSNQTSPRLR